MAASPPFTATYMSVALLENLDTARQAGEPIARRQNDVDAAWEARMVGVPLGAETSRQPGDREPPAFLDAGAAQHQGRARAEMRDRDDQARRAVGIFVGAGVELGKRAERSGVADQREACLLGRVDQFDAGVEPQE